MSEELKPCPLCGSYIITEDVIERLRMAHKEQGQHGDPVGEPGDNPFELSKRSVAREIFDEFEKLFERNCTCLNDWHLFQELKKKYLVGERDADISRENDK